jgi:hypothetical protein
VFANVSHFHRSLVFSSKAGAYYSGAPNGSLLLRLASSLARNIRLEWARITAVKSFIVHAPDSTKVLHSRAGTVFYYENPSVTAVKSFIGLTPDSSKVLHSRAGTVFYYENPQITAVKSFIGSAHVLIFM